MNTKCILLLLAALGATTLHAGSRSSASYRIATDVTDTAGRRASSASHTNDGSAGVSTVAAPVEIAKSGYIAQLYEVAGVAPNAAPLTVNEGGNLQLAA